MENKETKQCPFCSEEILATAIKCKHCGSMVAETPHTAGTDFLSFTKLALSSKYEIHSEIGRGGMASVYRAIQLNLGRIVALKVIHPNLVHDIELLDRFHREARISAQLNHSNIITIYDEGIESGIHFMAMELLEGIDLHKRIKEMGTISPQELVSIITPIAYALDYAHSKGLVHRDVKTSNIFLTSSGRPVLMDFGIAHADKGTQLTMSGSIIGTPEFMSPEQADGLEVDGRSDIYSLGVVMYQALTGRLPHSADNPIVTINKILNERYTPLHKIVTNIPDWLESIIDNCLVKDRTLRIKTGSELVVKLHEKKVIKLKIKEKVVQSELLTTKIDSQNAYKLKEKLIHEEISKTKTDTTEIKTFSPKKNLAPTLVLSAAGIIICVIIVLVLTQPASLPVIEHSKQINNIENKEMPSTNSGTFIENPVAEAKKEEKNIPETKKTEKVEKLEELIIVPNLTGSTIGSVRGVLNANGLKLGEVNKIPNPNNVNFVIKQIPKPDTQVKKGSIVNVWIGE